MLRDIPLYGFPEGLNHGEDSDGRPYQLQVIDIFNLNFGPQVFVERLLCFSASRREEELPARVPISLCPPAPYLVALDAYISFPQLERRTCYWNPMLEGSIFKIEGFSTAR